MNRRSFLTAAGRTAAGLVILGNSRSARSYWANQRLAIAVIGVGGMGAVNLSLVAADNVEIRSGYRIARGEAVEGTGESIVALCDVDVRTAADSAPGRRNPPGDSLARFPRAKVYRDYRRMLDEMDARIDAVVVNTPDHIHAPASVTAMRRGKHVYCEKPGAHTVYEARVAAEVAAEQQVATQLGTQMHASENYRRILELLQAGAIGSVDAFHIWLRGGGGTSNRPQDRPPVPDGLDWDLFLGPTAYRPYHPTYCRGCGGNWQRWWDFGHGNLGNMGCHYFDLGFWGLDLKYPRTVQAEGPEPHSETAPGRLQVRYEFPARGSRPPATLTWTHGSRGPAVFTEHDAPDWAWGVFVGSEGMLWVNYHQHRLAPEPQFADFVPPEPSLASSIGHHAEWIAACKTGSPTGCHFGYSGPVAEAVMLGSVAYRCGEPLEWDAAHLRVTNVPEANDLLHREYRDGWTL